MKKLIWPVVMLMAAGCCSIERTSPVPVRSRQYKEGSETERVHLTNYGFYFLGKYPIVCGNLNALHGMEWFNDTVTLDSVQNRLRKIADKEEKAMIEIQPTIHETSEFACIPYVGSTLGLITYKEVQISAQLLKEGK